MTRKNKQEWYEINIRGQKLCYKAADYPETTHMYYNYSKATRKIHVLKACNLLSITPAGHPLIEVHPASGQVYTRLVSATLLAERPDRKEAAK